MYSGKLQLTCQNIGKLYVTASILKIARVKKKCARILTKSPYDPKHAVYVYVTARKYGLTTVCKRALKLLHHRLEETVTCKPYLDLDVNQVCDVLSGNTVGARGEMVIFLAALHWLNHNYLQNEPYVLKVMQCVRFGTMSIEELLCCLHPPLLPGIMEVHEVRAHILAALCYKVAAMYNQQHLFPAPQLNARYFKLDGPITLWDLNLFSTDKNLPVAAPASGCPRYLNDASANILRKALPLATQLSAQREPVFHSDPLADYLLRNQAEIPLSPWNDDPYAGLGAHASGARDPLSPVLLVVGGFDPDAPGDTAVGTKILRYHVENNIWEKLDSFPMPRHHHSAVLYRDKLYITGGYDNYQTARSKLEPTSVCFSYDLTKKLWQPLPNMARCRAYHASGCFDGTLFVVGGRSSNGEILSSVEALCLDERRQWQEMPCRLCRPRMAAGSTQMGGRLWLAGGLTDSRAGLVVISDVDCFDPCSCEFFYHVNFLPTPRCFFSLVAVGDKLFALGGCSVRDSELESLGDVWSCLDHCWERRGTFDQGYHDVATVAYGDRVFMVGGLSSDTKSGIRAVSCYRSTHNAFTPSLAPLPRALCGASVVVLPPMEMEVAANYAGLDGNRWTGNSRIDSDVAGEPLANTGKCVSFNTKL
ncbi:kelch repeat and BTB domain-containing protein 8-like isoform X2 [Rhipicephalus microplus]|uniref:kelch repeat and BTB domain-containing protein 8-like isoform X2 n=1 Tax=Rhipicephalus microplus TaxID=6941 RepID=UPI003F6B63A2